MIESLRSYSLASHLKRAVLCTIAYTLDSDEISYLREAFITMDQSNSGTISLADFRAALKPYGVASDEIKRIFHVGFAGERDDYGPPFRALRHDAYNQERMMLQQL